jgi:ribosomal protein S18 acetylase RimI-like enzyme
VPAEFEIRPLVKEDRALVEALMVEVWGGSTVVSRGKVSHPGTLPGFLVHQDGKGLGLLTYRIDGRECEIVTLQSRVERRGVGTALIEAARSTASKAGCDRLWLVSTNDNTDAIRFYQRRGFVLAAVHRNAVRESRQLKPEIPEIGLHGIPIRDEIELEMAL